MTGGGDGIRGRDADIRSDKTERMKHRRRLRARWKCGKEMKETEWGGDKSQIGKRKIWNRRS